MSRFAARRALLAAGAAAAVLPLRGQAQAGRAPTEGTEFRVLSPAQPTDSGAKVEVLEFFQYTCPHCYTFHPDVVAWRKANAAEIDFRRVPINWDNSTLNHTKTYYAIEQLKRLDDLHDRFFDAIHKNNPRRQMYLDAAQIADFMEANGIDKKTWGDAFNSFSVNTRTTRAMQLWRAYKIDGTPAVGIDGRFVTAPSMAGTRQGALATMSFLVARARRERGSPAAKK